MKSFKRDENRIPTLGATLNADGQTMQNIYANPTLKSLKTSDGTDAGIVNGSLISSYTKGGGLVFSLCTTSYVGVAQTFFNSVECDLYGCSFFLTKQGGTPTGNAYANLYNITGISGFSGKPTGTELVTSDAFDVSTLTTSSAREKNLTFSTKYRMMANTYYAIAFQYAGTGNVADKVGVVADIATPSDTGNASYKAPNWAVYLPAEIKYNVFGTNFADNLIGDKDGNRTSGLIGTSSSDGVTPVPIYADNLGNLLIKST